MIVFVETNFVLELALMQEERAYCESILRLAQSGHIRLALPAFSLLEPYGTLTLRKVQRNRLQPDLAKVLQELSRTEPYEHLAKATERAMDGLLSDSTDEESDRLQAVRERIASVAEVVPLDADVIAAAQEHQKRHDMSPQDAVVFASVLTHLQREKPPRSCFLNRNSHDFGGPATRADLRRHGCRLITHFAQGYSYIMSADPVG